MVTYGSIVTTRTRLLHSLNKICAWFFFIRTRPFGPGFLLVVQEFILQIWHPIGPSEQSHPVRGSYWSLPNSLFYRSGIPLALQNKAIRSEVPIGPFQTDYFTDPASHWPFRIKPSGPGFLLVPSKQNGSENQGVRSLQQRKCFKNTLNIWINILFTIKKRYT